MFDVAILVGIVLAIFSGFMALYFGLLLLLAKASEMIDPTDCGRT